MSAASHRIVNWDKMKSVINPLLGKCQVCKCDGLELTETSRINFASNFEVVCKTCNLKAKKLEQHIFYLQREYNKMITTTVNSQKNKSNAYQNLANRKTALKKMKCSKEQMRVHPIPNKRRNKVKEINRTRVNLKSIFEQC